MTSKLVLTILLSSVLVMSVVAMSLQAADAAKGAGSYLSKTRHKNVCGDRLCTEPAAAPAQPKKMKEEKKEQMMKEEEMMMKEQVRAAHEMKTKTGTLTSVQDPGQGHESHQLAIILAPSDKTYTGLLTYSASENIQLVALHGPLAPGEDAGQAIWTPDGETKFALTFVDPDNAMGTWAFSGNALAVHTMNTEPFQVSYSVVASK